MKKGDFPSGSFLGSNVREIAKLMKDLEKYIEKFEEAYNKKNTREFNILKKQVLQIQKQIQALV